MSEFDIVFLFIISDFLGFVDSIYIIPYHEAYYNSVRPQSTLNWLSPLAYEHMLSVYAAKVA